VVGVSADSVEASQRFRESLDLPYPLVSDPKGQVLRAYGVRWPVVGLARRVSYVVGRDGKIERAFSSELDADAHVSGACAFVSPRAGRR
jgi:thioredoxin-dependent peroxiredoxin